MEYPVTSATVEILPNGLTLILDPDPTAPVVSAQIWVSTGSMHEDANLGTGISHFLEHMVFKGTRDEDGETLADTVQGAGGHWNAYTSFDRTVYYIDGPAASLPVFMKTLTGLVFFPTLPESEFEKEKDVIRREIDMGLDDPDNVASQLLFSTVFQRDPRRHPVIGHRHLFDAVKYEDLLAYQRSRYTTDRCHVVISGDFDPAEVRELVVELTSECLPGCGREPLMVTDSPQIGPRKARGTFAIPTSRVSLAWKSPALDDPRSPAYDVLAAVLGRGRSSRLYRALRDEQELALEISAFSWTGPGREGLMAVSADADPSKRDALVDAVIREIANLAESDLEEDLKKAKRQIATSQFSSLTTASGRAADLASNWHEARDLDFTRRYLAAIQKVSVEDVKKAALSLNEDCLNLTILDPVDAPAPGRTSKDSRKKENILVRVFENGLRVAVIPDHRVPLVHVQAAVGGGLSSETSAVSGLSQLLSSCLTKGTASRNANELALALESLGASIKANPGNNAVLVQAAGLAPDFESIIDVFSEVMICPSFPVDVIQREKASQTAALEEALQDPLHTGFRSLREVVFSGTGYGLDTLGSPESLAALDRDALVSAHQRHFNSANVTLAICGDVVPDEVFELIGKKFASLPAGDRWSAPASVISGGGAITKHLPKKQAVLAIGFPGVSISSAQRYALAMIQEHVSDMAGPLFTRIREELGLAYQVGGTQFLGYDTGLFTFYLATSPEQAELARREILAEIQKVATEGIPVEAFDRVRSTVLSGLAIQQQSISSVSRHVALDLLFGHPADQHRKLADLYAALTPAEVATVAAQIFSVSPTIIEVLPEKE